MMRHSLARSKSLTLVSVMVALVLGLGSTALSRPPAAAAAASSTGSSGGAPGYWLVGNNGEVYQAGAPNYGDLRGVQLAQPVVGGAATPDGLGYWLVASDGGIFSYGDARFHGSTGGIKLNQPIVGMAADPVTGGYWMVAADGGIFAFNAPFFGSTGAIKLNKPVVGMAATPTGRGYWLVASDGGIFAFGDARFFGSTGGDHLVAPVIGMNATPSGNGYWLAARDGGVFSFGNAPFLGTSGTNGSPPIVAFMSTNAGYPFPPGSTGYDVSKYQCPPYGSLPAARTFAMVEIAGNLNAYPNSCYQTEANWAGANMSPYIFMTPMPSPAPPESMSGPAGNCTASNVTCQSYNFGYYWARHWVAYSDSLGIHRSVWWLDVEYGTWSTAPGAYPANDAVIAGAVGGLRASGALPGLYSTSLQWGAITGNQLTFPNIPLWEAGAYTLNDSNDPYSATAMCSGQVADHKPFAGGKITVVQYGWSTSGETQPVDPDYACR